MLGIVLQTRTVKQPGPAENVFQPIDLAYKGKLLLEPSAGMLVVPGHAIMVGMRQTALGILAAILVTGAVYFSLWPPMTDNLRAWVLPACVRMGALTTALWMAWDDLQRLPRWILSTTLVALALVALRPKLFLVLVPLIVVLAIMRPRFGQRRSGP